MTSKLYFLNKFKRILKEQLHNGKSREIGNIGYKRRRKTIQKHNTTCVGHHTTQVNANNTNTARASYKQRKQDTSLLQTAQARHEPPTNNESKPRVSYKQRKHDTSLLQTTGGKILLTLHY